MLLSIALHFPSRPTRSPIREPQRILPTLMQHPFANVQYYRNSQSTDAIHWKSSIDKEPEEIPPVPPLPRELSPASTAQTLTSPVSSPLAKMRNLPPMPLQTPPPLPPDLQPDPPKRSRPLPSLPNPRNLLRVPSKSAKSVDARSVARSHQASEHETRSLSAKSANGHYVKLSNKVTVVLGGQEDGVSEPLYCTGDVIDGMLVVPKPTGLLSLDVKVRHFSAEMLNDADASHPTTVSLRVSSK